MLACAEALKITKSNNPDQPDTNTLIHLLEIVLKNKFNGKSYIQLQRTAVGTKLALAHVNIFMGKLEQTILSPAPLKPAYYKRYIDDILILWPHSIIELNKFITFLNNYHPSIKFTSEDQKVDVETYIKLTNRQAYVHASSHHPQVLVKVWPSAR